MKWYKYIAGLFTVRQQVISHTRPSLLAWHLAGINQAEVTGHQPE